MYIRKSGVVTYAEVTVRVLIVLMVLIILIVLIVLVSNAPDITYFKKASLDYSSSSCPVSSCYSSEASF